MLLVYLHRLSLFCVHRVGRAWSMMRLCFRVLFVVPLPPVLSGWVARATFPFLHNLFTGLDNHTASLALGNFSAKHLPNPDTLAKQATWAVRTPSPKW